MTGLHQEPYVATDRTGRTRRWPSTAVRLWRRVDRSGGLEACWEWQGYRNPKGYGEIGTGGSGRAFTHRVAYEIAHGAIPDGLFVLHSCDNPPCCNPAHLRAGTALENSRDAVERGHLVAMRNEACGKAKLTDLEVADIRRRRAGGESCTSIARRYGVHPAHVSRIVRFLRRPLEAA